MWEVNRVKVKKDKFKTGEERLRKGKRNTKNRREKKRNSVSVGANAAVQLAQGCPLHIKDSNREMIAHAHER
jgi:hypothetical protein